MFSELGVRATFYINPGVLRDSADPASIERYFDLIDHHGERTTLSRAQILEIAAAGHTIGSHTYSHAQLTGLPVNEAQVEIRRGKETLEDLTGQAVPDFSYPFGLRRHFNRGLHRYCATIGIRTVASARPIPNAEPAAMLHRTLWRLNRSLNYNLDTLRINGRVFEALTGRSPVGDR